MRPRSAAVDNREALLAAGLDQLAHRGFHGTVIPTVAAQAGVGVGTFYRHFDSKEALANAVYQRWKRRLGEALVTDLPDAPIRRQLAEIWSRMVRFAAEHPDAVQFLELHHHEGYLDADSRHVDHQNHEQVRQFVVRGQEAGVFRDGRPEWLIAIVWGSFAGLLRATRRRGEALDAEACSFTERCVWEAIRA